MGIRGLAPALQRYGVLSPLSGESVIIDGPALVHRIFTECMIQRKEGCSFICQPSYSLLGQLVKGWLKELKNHNVTVRKIYFDGYLPPSKWEVRRERLLSQSQKVRASVFLHPFGANKSPDDAFSSVTPSVIVSKYTRQPTIDKLPKPPFLVPAVIEILKECQEWGPLIQVVPGEAEIFCAQDVRENGGIVLTTDSDLLIQDLGLNGRVSFLWDVVHDRSSGASALSTSTFSFHSITDQLGVKEIGGLPRVVFEQVNSGIRFDDALEQAKRGSTDILASPAYLSFLKEYQLDESIPYDQAVLSAIKPLDPRISEIVVQVLVMKESGLVVDTESRQSTRGPESLSMFLPIMIENRDLRSCWTASTHIRETAYRILQIISPYSSGEIIEYRTLEPSSGRSGRQIDIPGATEATDACVRLAATLKKLRENISSPRTQWLAFAMLQDVEDSHADEKTSLSATLLSQASATSNGIFDYSWDLIHYTAQIHASYYSLRMLKQILDVVTALKRELPGPLEELRESLASLPPITDWPSVEAMPGLLSASASEGILSNVTDILEIPRIDIEELAAESSRLNKKKRKQNNDNPRGSRQGRAKRSPSLNPFAILSQASQDK